MKKLNKTVISFVLIILASLTIISLYWLREAGGYLRFSDAAKFADIARNLVSGEGYRANFIFFAPNVLIKELPAYVFYIPPLMPLFIAGSFLLFGITDFSVIITSGVLYVLLVYAVFLLGRKLFGRLVGVLSGMAVASSSAFLDYATSGASEVLLAFEIVLAFYLFTLRKKWADVVAFLILVTMYFTRPQAFIYIAGGILYWLLLRFKISKSLRYFIGVLVLGFFIDRLVLAPLSGNFFLYSILTRGANAISQVPVSEAVSGQLRGKVVVGTTIVDVFKKTFYNLYNFYKLLPQIASPYMWGLFIIGLFRWGKNRIENSLKLATLFMVIITFLVTALTIPFFRYLHPVIPFVYLFATATIIWIVREMINGQWARIKPRSIVMKIRKEPLIVGISSFLVFLFVIGQMFGTILLDSRFKADRTNEGKPPVYVSLSWILKENTNSEDIVITNLDTWGSWYGERKTVWFPLEPNQLIPPEGQENPFDAIYLTSYLMDDENYYMGDEWRQVFYNPKNPENEFIAENYELKEMFEIDAENVYERQNVRAVLLTRKN